MPDVLIGLARGGLLTARLLSDFLKVKEIITIQSEYYKTIEQTTSSPKLLNDIILNLVGKKVLICDDLVDTGETMNNMFNHLKEKCCDEVKVATLHKKPWSKIVPHFFIQETDAWIIYPWELAETIRALNEEKKNPEELEKFLVGLGIKKKLILDMFSFLKIGGKVQE